jgi:hypothetical protein
VPNMSHRYPADQQGVPIIEHIGNQLSFFSHNRAFALVLSGEGGRLLCTLSARASVTANSSPPDVSYSCRLSTSCSCQLTVSVSDSTPPLSVGASARGDDTRGGGGEGCGGAAAAAAPSSRVASLHAGSCCCQTTPPARPQLAANSML